MVASVYRGSEVGASEGCVKANIRSDKGCSDAPSVESVVMILGLETL